MRGEEKTEALSCLDGSKTCPLADDITSNYHSVFTVEH